MTASSQAAAIPKKSKKRSNNKKSLSTTAFQSSSSSAAAAAALAASSASSVMVMASFAGAGSVVKTTNDDDISLQDSFANASSATIPHSGKSASAGSLVRNMCCRQSPLPGRKQRPTNSLRSSSLHHINNSSHHHNNNNPSSSSSTTLGNTSTSSLYCKLLNESSSSSDDDDENGVLDFDVEAYKKEQQAATTTTKKKKQLAPGSSTGELSEQQAPTTVKNRQQLFTTTTSSDPSLQIQPEPPVSPTPRGSRRTLLSSKGGKAKSTSLRNLLVGSLSPKRTRQQQQQPPRPRTLSYQDLPFSQALHKQPSVMAAAPPPPQLEEKFRETTTTTTKDDDDDDAMSSTLSASSDDDGSLVLNVACGDTVVWIKSPNSRKKHVELNIVSKKRHPEKQRRSKGSKLVSNNNNSQHLPRGSNSSRGAARKKLHNSITIPVQELPSDDQKHFRNSVTLPVPRPLVDEETEEFAGEENAKEVLPSSHLMLSSPDCLAAPPKPLPALTPKHELPSREQQQSFDEDDYLKKKSDHQKSALHQASVSEPFQVSSAADWDESDKKKKTVIQASVSDHQLFQSKQQQQQQQRIRSVSDHELIALPARIGERPLKVTKTKQLKQAQKKISHSTGSGRNEYEIDGGKKTAAATAASHSRGMSMDAFFKGVAGGAGVGSGSPPVQQPRPTVSRHVVVSSAKPQPQRGAASSFKKGATSSSNPPISYKLEQATLSTTTTADAASGHSRTSILTQTSQKSSGSRNSCRKSVSDISLQQKSKLAGSAVVAPKRATSDITSSARMNRNSASPGARSMAASCVLVSPIKRPSSPVQKQRPSSPSRSSSPNRQAESKKQSSPSPTSVLLPDDSITNSGASSSEFILNTTPGRDTVWVKAQQQTRANPHLELNICQKSPSGLAAHSDHQVLMQQSAPSMMIASPAGSTSSLPTQLRSSKKHSASQYSRSSSRRGGSKAPAAAPTSKRLLLPKTPY